MTTARRGLGPRGVWVPTGRDDGVSRAARLVSGGDRQRRRVAIGMRGRVVGIGGGGAWSRGGSAAAPAGEGKEEEAAPRLAG